MYGERCTRRVDRVSGTRGPAPRHVSGFPRRKSVAHSSRLCLLHDAPIPVEDGEHRLPARGARFDARGTGHIGEEIYGGAIAVEGPDVDVSMSSLDADR